MGSNEEKSIFIETVNAFQDVFEVKFAYLSNVLFFRADVEVVPSNCVNFVFLRGWAFGFTPFIGLLGCN